MRAILKIRANDEQDGAELIIGYEPMVNEHGMGYRLIASNGDDVGYYKPKSIKDCIDDAWAMWEQWNTVEAMSLR